AAESLSPWRMRSETRRKDRQYKSFYCRAWQFRETETPHNAGAENRLRSGCERARSVAQARSDHRGLCRNCCIGGRQFSFLATPTTEKFRPRISYSRKEHCGDAIRKFERR